MFITAWNISVRNKSQRGLTLTRKNFRFQIIDMIEKFWIINVPHEKREISPPRGRENYLPDAHHSRLFTETQTVRTNVTHSSNWEIKQTKFQRSSLIVWRWEKILLFIITLINRRVLMAIECSSPTNQSADPRLNYRSRKLYKTSVKTELASGT